jgi:uncharacterized protein (TIGR02757 family)
MAKRIAGSFSKAELKDFLEEKVFLYNNTRFIETDPVSIPHLFSKKEDIEIAGFLSATIAWGQRKTILRNGRLLMQCMEDDPHRFILNFTESDLNPFRKFVHRTFHADDCIFFLKSLKNIYEKKGGLSNLFTANGLNGSEQLKDAILHTRNLFFELPHLKRNEKHFSDPSTGSAAKRLNMFLRWMVRQDKSGVDFGIWKEISSAHLICPLDVHSGRVARKLGLLKRKQNDWKAATELTDNLKKMDPGDPVKYDFALFGLGVFEKF